MLLSYLFNWNYTFIYVVLSILVGFTIHEFAHAFVADRLGDDTPRSTGRISLNPLAHLDLLGTIFLFLAGFGWGKPVMINPRNFKNPKMDNLTVSLSGPMSNLALATLFGLIYRFFHLPVFIEAFLSFLLFVK